MRVYFEKPRTTIGWKGLINDPGMDNSFDVDRGLRTARRLLLDIIESVCAVGCEFLEPTSPQYIADAVAWGAIGARTTESQVHRQLASGLSMPVGFKNGTDGNIQVAVDGVKAAAAQHVFFGLDNMGRGALVDTEGNDGLPRHPARRTDGPNYDAESVTAASWLAGRTARAGHDRLQPRQFRQGPHPPGRGGHGDRGPYRRGEHGISGLMLESFLVAGSQPLPASPGGELLYGQSVTDKCMDWAAIRSGVAELAAR